MNILSSKQDFNLLYIGPTDISEEIKKNIPKSWKLISVETLKEFFLHQSEALLTAKALLEIKEEV